MGAVREVDISRAIDYTRERERQIEADRRVIQLPAAAIADCIGSGLSGRALADTLGHHFPNAKRADVYLGIGLAIAFLQADLTICDMELAALRQEGARA